MNCDRLAYTPELVVIGGAVSWIDGCVLVIVWALVAIAVRQLAIPFMSIAAGGLAIVLSR